MTRDVDLPSELAEARARLAELEAAEAARRHAEKVQAGLFRIAELASAAQDMREFYRAVHAVVGELIYANNFFIALYDERRQLISWPYYVDELDLDIPDPNQWDEFGTGNARGTTAYVLRTGEPQLLMYERMQELIDEGEIELIGATVEESSWLGVPLKSEGQTVGVLAVQSYTKSVQYSEQDKELLAFVGQHIGAALARARAIEETRQRNAELALINSVQEALAGELELQAIYDVVGDRLRDVFDAQVVDIAVYDEASGLLHFPYSIERGVRFEDEPIELVGFRRHVMERREPLLIDESLPEAAERYGNPVLGSGEIPKSALYVPLVVSGEATGVISLQNMDQEHAFADSDQQLLATLARSLSVALENARLVHETRQRNAELALINSVQEALAGELELQAIYDLVGDKIQEIFDAQVVDIGVFDFDAGLTRYPYTIERGVRSPGPPAPISESPPNRELLETKAPVLIGDLEAWDRERGKTPVVGEVPRSLLLAPLVSGDEVRGRISLQNLDRTNAFSENDVRLLTTLASSLSVALENARLVHETRQRNAELAVINDVQAAVAGELDPQAIYDLVGDKLQEVFDAQVVSISMHDQATGFLHFPYVIERGKHLPQEPIPVIGFRKHVLESREPLMINEDMDAASERYGNPRVLSGESVQSCIFVPLVAGGKATGVVSLQNVDREHAFSDSDLELLTTLSGSVSVALENARLVQETRQRVAELATVNSVGQALASQFELDALIELVGERVRETFDADIAYVALHDETAGQIDFAYYYETGERREEPPLEYGEGLTSRILDSGEPLLLNRQEQYERLATVGTPFRSYLGVPIFVGETAIGVISVQSIREEGRFGEAESGLLATIAANVGIAIQKARLFEAQREAERRYRELVEELPLAVYRDEPVAVAASEYVSPRVEEIFGYPREAWSQPEFFASILHPADRDETIAKHAAALARGDDRWSFEYRVIAADGRTVFVRDDARIAKDDDGSPVYVQGFMMDVTDQALAHAEIRRQKQYFESLVEVSPVAIVVMDADERVTSWNPAAAELFGWSAEEAKGRLIDELVFEQGQSEEGQEMTREALETGRAQTIARRLRKDGAVVDVELMLVPLTVDGEHVGYYAIYHDITELQRAREEAEAATQAKSAFLATMSHEIRTPMNAVIGMTGLLLGTELTPEQHEFAEVVRSSGDALLHVIDDILDYSKIEAGKLELEKEPVDLRECVEGALDIVAPRAWEKKIELGCLIDANAPTGIVGDVARLRQVLLNLLSNAVKFTEEGEVVVHVDAVHTGASSYRLELAVRDTGIGIPEDRRERLFASFSQVDASTTRRYGGTGLGLAISKRLVEMMGGTMSVESVEGKGSTFRLSLPVKAAEVPSRVAEHGPVPRLVGKRILVVDDNATNREIVARHAQSWAMEAVMIASPSEALARIDEGDPFDVAVLDMMMPGMDGLALAREIRRRRDKRELPLVLLTSLGRLPEGQSSGEFAVQLGKPVKGSQLYNALLKALAENVHEPEAGEAVSEQVRPKTSSLGILLAEDNAVNQKVALELLDQLGYRADVASNGVEALEALERHPYDVVLMDVQMPELDGLDASRRISERWPRADRPRIIAMTANAMPEDREACLAAGMDDYIAKPIRPNELAEALSRAKPLRDKGEVRSDWASARFDTAALESLRELGGDDFLTEVIETFLADAPTLLGTLRRSLDEEDADELRRAAHTLKSNGLTFGVERFADLCQELERRARSGALDGAAELIDRIDREYAALERTLAALRSTAS